MLSVIIPCANDKTYDMNDIVLLDLTFARLQRTYHKIYDEQMLLRLLKEVDSLGRLSCQLLIVLNVV